MDNSGTPISSRRRRLRPIAAALLAALALSGCYSYVPTQEVPGRGARVRVRLSQPQDVRLTEITANDVMMINGEVVRANSDTLVLSAYLLQSRSGYENFGRGETAFVPRENIVGLFENRISVIRTAGLMGAVALLGVVVGVALNNAGGSDSGDGPPPATQ